MEPAIESKIPIYIRNTFEPHLEGTRIYLPSTKEVKVRERSVCGFTTVDNISLLNIEGTGMIGVPGIAHRLFGALHTDHISVMFIAQASSEHSICFATHTVYAERACEAIKHAFFYELKQGYISKIRVISDCSIIAAVGESMCQMPGVAGLFFGALGDASINVLSISQGCDERNISAVVYSRDATRALRAVHSAFWLSSLELSIGIVGTGRVGSALLQTLLENLDLLEARLGLKIKIRGVANSRKMLLGEDLTGSLREILSYFSSASNSATASASSVCSSAVNSPLRRTTTPAAAASAAAVVAKETLLELSTALFSAACTIGEPANVALDSNGALPHNRRKSRGMSMGTDVRKSDSTRSLQDLESAMSDSGDDKLDTNLELFLQHAKAGPTPHTGSQCSLICDICNIARLFRCLTSCCYR